eukprot:g7773.t1
MGICLGYKWAITDAQTVVALLSLSCAVFLLLHQLRRRLKAIDEFYLRRMGPLLRPSEIRGALPGAFWFMLGSAVAVAIFPRDVALQSILHLSLGDPVASVAGVRLGDRSRVLPSGKSLAGSFAAFAVCSMSTLLLFGCYGCVHPSNDETDSSFFHRGGESDRRRDTNSSGSMFGDFSACAELSGSDSHGRFSLQLWYALLGGLSGAVGEFLPLGVDDNLSMPVVAGVVFLTLVGASSSRL